MENTAGHNKKIVSDLLKLKGEFDSIVESIELMNDKEFMVSYGKAREQVKKRDFEPYAKL